MNLTSSDPTLNPRRLAACALVRALDQAPKAFQEHNGATKALLRKCAQASCPDAIVRENTDFLEHLLSKHLGYTVARYQNEVGSVKPEFQTPPPKRAAVLPGLLTMGAMLIGLASAAVGLTSGLSGCASTNATFGELRYSSSRDSAIGRLTLDEEFYPDGAPKSRHVVLDNGAGLASPVNAITADVVRSSVGAAIGAALQTVGGAGTTIARPTPTTAPPN